MVLKATRVTYEEVCAAQADPLLRQGKVLHFFLIYMTEP